MLHLYQLVGEFLLLFILTSIVLVFQVMAILIGVVSQCFNLHFPDNVQTSWEELTFWLMLSLPTCLELLHLFSSSQ